MGRRKPASEICHKNYTMLQCKTALHLLNGNNAKCKTVNTGTGLCEEVSVGSGREAGMDELGLWLLLFVRIRHV